MQAYVGKLTPQQIQDVAEFVFAVARRIAAP